MEKYAWKAHFKEGCKDEYRRRHDEIWPEMIRVLKNAGIKNYTIWNTENELFGYYECEKGVEFAAKVQDESLVVKKWNEYIVFAPKFRRKEIYGKLKKDIGQILRKLCEQKICKYRHHDHRGSGCRRDTFL